MAPVGWLRGGSGEARHRWGRFSVVSALHLPWSCALLSSSSASQLQGPNTAIVLFLPVSGTETHRSSATSLLSSPPCQPHVVVCCFGFVKQSDATANCADHCFVRTRMDSSVCRNHHFESTAAADFQFPNRRQRQCIMKPSSHVPGSLPA